MRLQHASAIGTLLFTLLYGCGSATIKTADTPVVVEPVELAEEKGMVGQKKVRSKEEDAVVREMKRVREFQVDKVDVASSPKKEFAFKKVLEDRISREVYQLSETDTSARLVPAGINAFVQCVHDAYAEHRPLSIRPDDVWMLIIQGFSIHANLHMEQLESEMFVSAKPDALTVRNDMLLEETPEAWKDLVHGLSRQVERYAKPKVYAAMVPSFSTTTATDHTAYEVAMLETASKVFTYAGESGCGIPSIRLEGAPEDWKAVQESFEKLTTYGLDDWFSGLNPVLEEFVKASNGEINQAFWQSIYKESIHYNAFYISGWIWKFFPYVRQYSVEPGGIYESFEYAPNEYLLGDSYAECTLDTRSFPSGISKVKVLWNIYKPETGDLIETREMLLHAGFMGLHQEDDLTLAPCIAWAVCYESSEDPEHVFRRNGNRGRLTHKEADWIGAVLADPDTKPIYAPEKNSSYEDGIAYLKRYLATQTQESIDGIEIGFKVSWIGTVYNVSVGSDSGDLNNQLQELMQTLPEAWSPAMSVIHKPGYDATTSYKVNYKVLIE